MMARRDDRRTAERTYSWLLRCFPSDFRERFGDEMLATARELDRDSGPVTRWQTVRFISDAITTAVRLHVDLRNEQRRNLLSGDRLTMDSLLGDLRFVMRGLGRDKGFTIFVIATLALGIGANAAMFGIADRLLLRGPEHVVKPQEIVRLYTTVTPAGMQPVTDMSVGAVSYELLREGSTAFDAVASYANNGVVLGQGVDAHQGSAEYVSETYFPLLGVQPELGRFIDASENQYGAAAHVAVISHATWQTAFGGEQDVLGKSVLVNNEPFTIIGVAPRGFTSVTLAPIDLWVPTNLYAPVRDARTSWNAQWLQVIGRLKPGVTPEQASAEAMRLHRNGYTGTDSATANAKLFFAPLTANASGVAPLELRILGWLSGVSLLVLLIACANVANLLLARGIRRSRELAIRAALGAGRRRIVSFLLTESLLLSLLGAGAGLLVAMLLGELARTTLFDTIAWGSSPIDLRIVAVASLLAIITSLLIGVVPAVRASRTDVSSALRAGVREGGGQRLVLRRALTVTQAALSVLLLVGAGLFLRSLWNVRTLQLGFDASKVLVVSTYREPLSKLAAEQRVAERARRQAFNERAIEQLTSVSGVKGVAVAVGMPFGNRFSVTTRIPGLDSTPRISTGGPSISAVSPDYFSVMGTRIVQGRAFTTSDRKGSSPVAIVSAEMARVVWPGKNPIGACIIVGSDSVPPCHVVVGIAADVHRSQLREDPVMHFYIPLGQEVGFGGAALIVRSEKDASEIASLVRQALFDMDASITYIDAAPLQETLNPMARPWRIGAIVFALLGSLALIVAAVGIYSVLTYLVADRRHEFGVRLALGAAGRNIVKLVLRESFAVAIVGVFLGEAMAFVLGRFAEPLLFDTTAHDPAVFVAVAFALITVALAATLVPAWRTRSINPMDALRAE